jgi:hypothetical protein
VEEYRDEYTNPENPWIAIIQVDRWAPRVQPGWTSAS